MVGPGGARGRGCRRVPVTRRFRRPPGRRGRSPILVPLHTAGRECLQSRQRLRADLGFVSRRWRDLCRLSRCRPETAVVGRRDCHCRQRHGHEESKRTVLGGPTGFPCPHGSAHLAGSRRVPTGPAGSTPLVLVGTAGGAAGDWSGRRDSNPRPQRPERCALPSCATSRWSDATAASRPSIRPAGRHSLRLGPRAGRSRAGTTRRGRCRRPPPLAPPAPGAGGRGA
jgi:hypothetical protein